MTLRSITNTPGRHLLGSFLLTSAVLIAAESAPSADATAQIVVTIKNSDIRNRLPPTMADIVLAQNSAVGPITKLVPLNSDNASIEMFAPCEVWVPR